MASRLLSTPTQSSKQRGPVVTDPQPKMLQLSLRVCFQQDPPETASTPEKPKRKYKARGTGGTFGGKRPPKALHLKDAFEEQRNAHLLELKEKKATKSNSYADRAYHKFMKEMLRLETSGSVQDRFRRVTEKWKSQAKGQSMDADNRSVM